VGSYSNQRAGSPAPPPPLPSEMPAPAPRPHRDRFLEDFDLEIALDRLPAHHHHREGERPLPAPLPGTKVYFSVGSVDERRRSIGFYHQNVAVRQWIENARMLEAGGEGLDLWARLKLTKTLGPLGRSPTRANTHTFAVNALRGTSRLKTNPAG
jgi:hypothetical protein